MQTKVTMVAVFGFSCAVVVAWNIVSCSQRMIVTNNRINKRTEFYIRREEKCRKTPIYMGGVSERQSS
jgi:hypothetical protein